MKKIFHIFIGPILISCCGCSTDYPYYEIDQNYTSKVDSTGMIYDITTTVNRYTENTCSGDCDNHDDIKTPVWSSVLTNIPSESIDSMLLNQKSTANMRVSEFQHLDDLTKGDEE